MLCGKPEATDGNKRPGATAERSEPALDNTPAARTSAKVRVTPSGLFHGRHQSASAQAVQHRGRSGLLVPGRLHRCSWPTTWGTQRRTCFLPRHNRHEKREKSLREGTGQEFQAEVGRSPKPHKKEEKQPTWNTTSYPAKTSLRNNTTRLALPRQPNPSQARTIAASLSRTPLIYYKPTEKKRRSSSRGHGISQVHTPRCLWQCRIAPPSTSLPAGKRGKKKYMCTLFSYLMLRFLLGLDLLLLLFLLLFGTWAARRVFVAPLRAPLFRLHHKSARSGDSPTDR